MPGVAYRGIFCPLFFGKTKTRALSLSRWPTDGAPTRRLPACASVYVCFNLSSNPKKVPFNKRHGFQVLGEYYPFATGADKGPLITLMFRPLPAAS